MKSPFPCQGGCYSLKFMPSSTGGELGLGDEEAVQQRVFCSGLTRGKILSEMCLYVSVARTGSLDPLLAKRNMTARDQSFLTGTRQRRQTIICFTLWKSSVLVSHLERRQVWSERQVFR